MEMLKGLAPEVLLLSHGNSIVGEEAIDKEIENSEVSSGGVGGEWRDRY